MKKIVIICLAFFGACLSNQAFAWDCPNFVVINNSGVDQGQNQKDRNGDYFDGVGISGPNARTSDVHYLGVGDNNTMSYQSNHNAFPGLDCDGKYTLERVESMTTYPFGGDSVYTVNENDTRSTVTFEITPNLDGNGHYMVVQR